MTTFQIHQLASAFQVSYIDHIEERSATWETQML
jgi:hypothetical protein